MRKFVFPVLAWILLQLTNFCTGLIVVVICGGMLAVLFYVGVTIYMLTGLWSIPIAIGLILLGKRCR